MINFIFHRFQRNPAGRKKVYLRPGLSASRTECRGFHEICDQHAAIDCEEHSNVALALIALNPFEQLAGRMFYEASESDLKHIPDDVFLTMGRRLDCQHVSLAENLDTRGREILKHLGRQGKPIVTWEAALSDKSEREFLPE